jgi:hypothetical protein
MSRCSDALPAFVAALECPQSTNRSSGQTCDPTGGALANISNACISSGHGFVCRDGQTHQARTSAGQLSVVNHKRVIDFHSTAILVERLRVTEFIDRIVHRFSEIYSCNRTQSWVI